MWKIIGGEKNGLGLNAESELPKLYFIRRDDVHVHYQGNIMSLAYS